MWHSWQLNTASSPAVLLACCGRVATSRSGENPPNSDIMPSLVRAVAKCGAVEFYTMFPPMAGFSPRAFVVNMAMALCFGPSIR